MTRGLVKTFEILTETKNEAALAVLLAGLTSSNHDRQIACLRALLDRRSNAGHRELVRRWHTFNDTWKSLVAERATRVEGAVRSAILCTDAELHQNACDAVVYLQGYDLIPTLITAAEDKGNAQASLAARAVISLCELLYKELTAPRDYSKRRDPVLVRQFIFSALENAVRRFDHHRRPELVEAFLLLARPDDPALKFLLRDQREIIYAATTNLLTHSVRRGVMQLVLRSLDDLQAPSAIYGILGRRSDFVFLRLLFQRMSQQPSATLRANLRKIEGFEWLREDLEFLREFTDEELRGAVHLILASGMSRLRVFDVLKFVMRHGGILTRRAASAALASFKGGAANDLVLSAVEDSDPEVQAIAVRQLRDRGLPGIMARLVELVDSPQEVVRDAARQSLSEFNFQRFLGAFEMLEPEVRRCSGGLVVRIDPRAIEELQAELLSTSRTRRLRGIEVAVAMGVVRQVESCILQLATDNDHFVRAEAARAMVHTDSEKSRAVLQELLNDRSMSVQEAAQEAFEQLKLIPIRAPGNSDLRTAGLDPIVLPTLPVETTS